MIFHTLVIAAALSGAASAGGFSAPVGARSHSMTFETPADGPLIFRGAIAVSPPMEKFGGISGVAMEGPRKLLAITDRGDWLRMSLEIEEGRLIGVDDVQMAPMVTWNGGPLPDGAYDAEDLTRDPETGQVYVSYESYNRIWRHDTPGGRPTQTLEHSDWSGLNVNSGVEGLALAPDGALWAIAEQEFAGKFLIWVKTEDGWLVKTAPARGPYQPTGADFGPDGYLYVTERAFSYFQGFRFRLRRFKWGEGGAPTEEEEVLSLGAETGIDNIEAVTTWREDGRDYLLIASDDNFFPLERNVLALFEIVK